MKTTLTIDTDRHDITPIRLPNGRKAYAVLPMDFTAEDAERIKEWMLLYVVPRALPAPPNVK